MKKYGNTKTVDDETFKDGINHVKNWTDKVASDKNFNSILTDKEHNLNVSHDKFVKDLVKHFRKLKYDAIVDPEDYTRVESGTYIFDEPLIILNKNKSVVETGRKYVDLDDVASVSTKDMFDANNTVEMKYKVL